MNPIGSIGNALVAAARGPADIYSPAVQGMQRAQEGFAEAAQQVASGNLDPQPMVEMMVNSTVFAANAQVLRTADEMVGTLLNTYA